MNSKRVHGFAVVSLLIVSAVLSEGCRRGPYLWVRSAKYQPSLPTYLGQSYRGRSIHLMSFASRTPSRWYYYNPTRTIKYEASPSLAGYLRECFTKGLTTSGVRILPRATQNVHSLRVVLLRMSDQQMVFDAFLYLNRRTIFQKRFVISRGPVRSFQKQHLAQMASYHVNLAIAKLFMDHGFWRSFFGAARPTQPPTPGGGGPTGGPAGGPTPTPLPTPTPAPGAPPPAPGAPPAPGGR